MSDEKRISRIEINDYVAFGEQIAKWSLDGSKLPNTIAEVKAELEKNYGTTGINRPVVIFPPDRFPDTAKVNFVQSPLRDEWLVRLPPKEMVKESVDWLKAEKPYPVEHLPNHYSEYENKAHDLEFLYCRIADYTVSQCA